jgi:nickel superoxide dismutase
MIIFDHLNKEDYYEKIIFHFSQRLISFLFFSFKTSAHCEIPCGIHDDEMRVTIMNEHIATIKKCINHIMKIAKEKEQHHSNQFVRWIINQEISCLM